MPPAPKAMNPKEPSQQAAGTESLIGAEIMGKLRRNYADIIPKVYGNFSKPKSQPAKKILVIDSDDGFELSIQTVIHEIGSYYYYELPPEPNDPQQRVIHRVHKNACWPVEQLEEIQADWSNFCGMITARRQRLANLKGPGVSAKLGDKSALFSKKEKAEKTDEQIGLEFLKDLRRQQRERATND